VVVEAHAVVVRVQPQFAPPKKAQPVGVVEICAVTGAKPRRRIAASGTHSTADLPLKREGGSVSCVRIIGRVASAQPDLIARRPRGIHRCMTEVLTVRVPPDLLAKADARAAQLGLDRGKYVRALIEDDVTAGAKQGRRRRFSSESFIGSVPLGRGPYMNRRVRALVRDRLAAKREKNR